jgi:hypothetical protein
LYGPNPSRAEDDALEGNCSWNFNPVSRFVPIMEVGSAGRGAIAAEFGTILPNQFPLTPGLSEPPSSG